MANHICIISPSLKMGGIERALTVLANYFINAGFQVTFISCLAGFHFYELDKKIKLIEPSFGRTKGVTNAVIFYLRLIFFLKKTVVKEKPDKVISFGDWFNPIVLLSLFGTKYPVFISDRTSPDYNFKFPIPQLKKWLYPKSAGFLAQTQRAAEYRHKEFGNKLKIQIIPNAIREVKLYPEIQREKIILYVGRFAWEKAPDRLIRAFAAIESKNDWKLYMAGSGPLLKPMRQLALKLNVENEIVFLGKVNDVDRLFAKSSIYVLPSVLEGFPNSLCEAMAAGLPVICFDSIPHEEILISGFDGLVVKNEDISDLSYKLSKLMFDKNLRETLSKNAMEIRNRLNVSVIGEKILDFIQG